MKEQHTQSKGFEKFPEIKKEIKSSIGSLLVFDTIIDSLAIFAAFYLIFMLLAISPLYGAAISAAYFVPALYLRLRTNKLLMVEKKYSELDIKLRTAADNVGLKNEVAEALDNEIAQEIKNVELSSFFGSRKNTIKITGIIILCFLIVFLSSLNTEFWDVKLFVEDVIKPKPVDNNARIGVDVQAAPLGTEVVFSAVTSGDIYGESSMAPGNVTQQLEVDPIGYEMNIRQEGDSYDEEFEDQFPKEVFAQSAKAHGETIPIEKQELVKRYFKEVAR